MIAILNIILLALVSTTIATKSLSCRPTAHFFHIGHGAVSGFVDHNILSGSYEVVYTLRQRSTRAKGQSVAALSSKTKFSYVIQSECRLQYQKGGVAVSIVDVEKNITQNLKYPMGFNQKPITLMSNRGQPVLIECIDVALFSFDVLLKGSTQVVGRVRNMVIPTAIRTDMAIKEAFTLEVDGLYKDMTPFLIATAVALDEYMYPASIEQKRKHCI